LGWLPSVAPSCEISRWLDPHHSGFAYDSGPQQSLAVENVPEPFGFRHAVNGLAYEEMSVQATFELSGATRKWVTYSGSFTVEYVPSVATGPATCLPCWSNS
jgi:hypothetical protein